MKDPLIEAAEDYYGSQFYYFLILDANDLTADQILSSGSTVKLPPRGNKKSLKKAYWWRKHLGVPE